MPSRFSLNDTKANFTFLGKQLDTSVDLTAIVDAGLLAGFAQAFLEDKLHVGVTSKILVRAGGRRNFTLDDIASQTGFTSNLQQIGGVGGGLDFDLGAIYDLPWSPGIASHVGLSLNNILATNFTMIHAAGGNPPQLPRLVSLGLHTVFAGYGWIDNFHVLLDFAEFQVGGQSDPNLGARSGAFFKHVNLGLEVPIDGWFIPRLGIHQGWFTAGFGLDLTFLKLDFATYEEELSFSPGRFGNRRYTARVQFGIGGPPAPALQSKESLPARPLAPPPGPLPEDGSPKPEPTTPVLTPNAVPTNKEDGFQPPKDMKPDEAPLAPVKEAKPGDAPAGDTKPADAPATETKPADAPAKETKPANAPPQGEQPKEGK